VATRGDAHHRGIVGELVVDDDVRWRLARAASFETIQDVRQLAEPQLGGSTAAERVLREADCRLGFGSHRSHRSSSLGLRWNARASVVQIFKRLL
jgi:hypothetical protein